MSTKDLFEKYVTEVCSKCEHRANHKFDLCNITIHEDNRTKEAKCDYYEKKR